MNKKELEDRNRELEKRILELEKLELKDDIIPSYSFSNITESQLKSIVNIKLK